MTQQYYEVIEEILMISDGKIRITNAKDLDIIIDDKQNWILIGGKDEEMKVYPMDKMHDIFNSYFGNVDSSEYHIISFTEATTGKPVYTIIDCICMENREFMSYILENEIKDNEQIKKRLDDQPSKKIFIFEYLDPFQTFEFFSKETMTQNINYYCKNINAIVNLKDLYNLCKFLQVNNEIKWS